MTASSLGMTPSVLSDLRRPRPRIGNLGVDLRVARRLAVAVIARSEPGVGQPPNEGEDRVDRDRLFRLVRHLDAPRDDALRHATRRRLLRRLLLARQLRLNRVADV